jgi:hypothetical protein
MCSPNGCKSRPASRASSTSRSSDCFAADLVGEAVLDSLRALREEIADISARLDAAEAIATTIPSREHYLLLNHRLARRIVKAHTDWLDEVERELG